MRDRGRTAPVDGEIPADVDQGVALAEADRPLGKEVDKVTEYYPAYPQWESKRGRS